MSVTETLRDRFTEPERRRSIRLIKPRAQLKLAAYLLLISLAFGGLVALNSWSAYGRLFQGSLSTAPAPFKQDILDQTHSYVNISLVLLFAYVVTMLGVTIGYLHRLIGPTVAMERQLRAMLRGDYSSRLTLRSGDDLYSDLANQLNDLANRMEQAARAKR